MEVLNRAIESIMNSTDRDDWEPTVIHITDNVLSLWKGEVPLALNMKPCLSVRSNVTSALFHLCYLILTGGGGAVLGVSGTFPDLSWRWS